MSAAPKPSDPAPTTPQAQTLRAQYFNLGVALADRQQFAEAAGALEKAFNEEGPEPPAVDILFRLAESYDQAGRGTQAFRAYLKAACLSTAHLPAVLARVHALLVPDVALAHASYVTGDWAATMAGAGLSDSDRMMVALFLGRVSLYLAEYEKALEHFRQARQLAPQEAAAAAERLLGFPWPPALADSHDGEAHFILAQVYRAFDRTADALREVEEALRLGLSRGEYPEGPALRLKAELLEAAGQLRESARCHYEAARRFNWRNDLPEAARLLEHAAELWDDHAPIYWLWADTLLRQSYVSERPFVDRRQIQAAQERWEQGTKISYPDADHAWAYLSRALILDQVARLPESPQWDGYWEAAAAAECALVLGDGRAVVWAHLARYCRFLQMEGCALELSRQALERDPNDPTALEERAAVLANRGEFVKAEEEIDKRRKLPPGSPWLDGIKAYTLLHRHQYAEALPYLDLGVKQDPDPTWHLSMRAQCYHRLGDTTRAGADLQRIWDRYRPDDRVNSTTYAWAAFRMRNLKDAIPLLEQARDDRTEVPGYASDLLGLCHLAQGSIATAERYLAEGIGQAPNVSKLDHLVAFELVAFEKDRERFTDFFTDVMNRIDERRNQLRGQEPSAEHELTKVLQDLEDKDQRKDWAWVGAQAGLARICAGQERWREAADRYLRLEQQADRFPVARAALAQVVDRLRDAGTRRIREGVPAEGLEEFLLPALALVRRGVVDDSHRQADLHGLIGYAQFLRKDPSAARAHFAEALRLYHQAGRHDFKTGLGTVCQALLTQAGQYWDLDDFWRELGEAPDDDGILKQGFAAARRTLADYLGIHQGLPAGSEDSADQIPWVTPIAVEIVPRPEGPLLKTYLSEMRARILKQMGVRIPHVRVRDGGDWLRGSYLILIDEIPLVLNQVKTDSRWCPAPPDRLRALGVPDDGLVEQPHPLTGAPGTWVREKYCEGLDGRIVESWSSPQFMVYQLEAVLRNNLAHFLGIQEVESLLEQWGDTQATAERIKAALPDPASRLRFARTLRALVQERVPITAWEDILQAFGEAAPPQVDEADAVCAIRLRLRKQLPGNNPSATHLPLPEPLERRIAQGLRTQGGKVYLALSPTDTQDILAEIRLLVPAGQANVALVVKKLKLRICVWHLVQLEWPRLAVLAQEEVLVTDTTLPPPAPPTATPARE